MYVTGRLLERSSLAKLLCSCLYKCQYKCWIICRYTPRYVPTDEYRLTKSEQELLIRTGPENSNYKMDTELWWCILVILAFAFVISYFLCFFHCLSCFSNFVMNFSIDLSYLYLLFIYFVKKHIIYKVRGQTPNPSFCMNFEINLWRMGCLQLIRVDCMHCP